VAEYFRPRSLREAVEIAANGDLTIAAGCTDLFPAMSSQYLRGPVLDVTSVEGLRGFTHEKGYLRIGAATTWSNVINYDLPSAFDGLKSAAREVGSVQIQNAATIAGNLCNASPAADGVPCLLTLDAEVELASQLGTRQLPLSDFLLGVRKTDLQPGEIMTAILVPDSALNGQSGFLKLGARRYLVISIAMVAVRIVVSGGHVERAALAVGACNDRAVRLSELENQLTGLPFDSKLSDAVTDDLVAQVLAPISDIRADKAYRRHAAAVLIRRALDGLCGGLA